MDGTVSSVQTSKLTMFLQAVVMQAKLEFEVMNTCRGDHTLGHFEVS